MNIISDYSRDKKTPKRIPGSYEWWYFDAQSFDGYRIVVIFYEGNPFSRRYIDAQIHSESASAEQFPAISISVYKKDVPIFYSFEEVEKPFAHFSGETPKGNVRENSFEGRRLKTHLEYKILLNQTLVNGDSIQAGLRFRSKQKPKPIFSSDDSISEQHEWNLVMPSCSVEGEIRICGYHNETIDFEGVGYHDHNVGFEPLKESFTEWYWGRYHLEDSTFVYYLMNNKGEWEKKAWMIHENGELLRCEDIELSQFGLSVFGLQTARVIRAKLRDAEIYLQLDENLDSGPFYQRFGGRLLIHSDVDMRESRGISEYIRPDRIYNRRFWPLINMRIAYPGKEHWVQKNPVLYRWTW